MIQPGFLAVELGADFPSQCSKEELLTAKEKAGVDVVVLCTPTTGQQPRLITGPTLKA